MHRPCVRKAVVLESDCGVMVALQVSIEIYTAEAMAGV